MASQHSVSHEKPRNEQLSEGLILILYSAAQASIKQLFRSERHERQKRAKTFLHHSIAEICQFNRTSASASKLFSVFVIAEENRGKSDRERKMHEN